MEKIKISVVVPVYKEAQIIEEFYKELRNVLEKNNYTYEIIFVHDDFSEAPSMEILKGIFKKDSSVKIIGLSRNFGQQIALTAGIDYAQGDAVITLDGDLQHPPALITEMVALWRKGNDIVYTIRKDAHNERFFKKITAKLFYALMSKISDYDVGFNCADFRLMSRKVVNSFKSIKEKTRFIRGLVSWMGYKRIALPFVAAPRKSGETKFSFKKMAEFALDGVLSFSTFPIKSISLIGIFVSFLAFMYIARMIYFVIFEKQGIPDYLPVMALILFLIGVQMIMIGIVGEYVAKIFAEAKNRPLYLIDEICDNSRKIKEEKEKACA